MSHWSPLRCDSALVSISTLSTPHCCRVSFRSACTYNILQDGRIVSGAAMQNSTQKQQEHQKQCQPKQPSSLPNSFPCPADQKHDSNRCMPVAELVYRSLEHLTLDVCKIHSCKALEALLWVQRRPSHGRTTLMCCPPRHIRLRMKCPCKVRPT